MAFLTVHFIAFPPGVCTFFFAASPDRPLVMTRIWVSKSQAWNQQIFCGRLRWTVEAQFVNFPSTKWESKVHTGAESMRTVVCPGLVPGMGGE